MNTFPGGIIQFQVVMSSVGKRALYGLADDGKVYQWDNVRKIWVATTNDKFDLRDT